MASYTEHLELLKKDPVADGADTFNIQTMLNNNWDKIDAAVAKKADLGEDGKVIPSQLPEMSYDPAGSAAAVQANLAAHIADKNNPHGLVAGDVGARPNTWVPAWGDVTGKPDSFPPSGHTHDASQITSGILSAARGGTGVGSIAELAALLKSNGIAGLQTGSYQGTGTYGSSNPTVFQFDAPKSLFFIGMLSNGFGVSGGSYCPLDAIQKTDEWVSGYRLSSVQGGGSLSSYGFKLSADRKTFSIYASNNATDQCNNEVYKYVWAAI